MNLRDVRNIDELLKTAVPQDLAEEFDSDTRFERQDKDYVSQSKEYVFPIDRLLMRVVQPLSSFVEDHKESGMLEPEVIEELESLYKQLSRLWYNLYLENK